MLRSDYYSLSCDALAQRINMTKWSKAVECSFATLAHMLLDNGIDRVIFFLSKFNTSFPVCGEVYTLVCTGCLMCTNTLSQQWYFFGMGFPLWCTPCVCFRYDGCYFFIYFLCIYLLSIKKKHANIEKHIWKLSVNEMQRWRITTHGGDKTGKYVRAIMNTVIRVSLVFPLKFMTGAITWGQRELPSVL